MYNVYIHIRYVVAGHWMHHGLVAQPSTIHTTDKNVFCASPVLTLVLIYSYGTVLRSPMSAADLLFIYLYIHMYVWCFFFFILQFFERLWHLKLRKTANQYMECWFQFSNKNETDLIKYLRMVKRSVGFFFLFCFICFWPCCKCCTRAITHSIRGIFRLIT